VLPVIVTPKEPGSQVDNDLGTVFFLGFWNLDALKQSLVTKLAEQATL
jgi:hypothetical protein